MSTNDSNAKPRIHKDQHAAAEDEQHGQKLRPFGSVGPDAEYDKLFAEAADRVFSRHDKLLRRLAE